MDTSVQAAVTKTWTQSVSNWTIISATLTALSAIMFCVGTMVGDRMVAGGNGFEMAFYLSPFIFQSIDALLIAAICVGIVGLFFVQQQRRPPLVFVTAVAIASLLLTPW